MNICKHKNAILAEQVCNGKILYAEAYKPQNHNMLVV